jgi:drug/metabolite transporter (DMT)-like permease
MDQVPDLRAFGMRMVHCVVALALGLVSAWKVAMWMPVGHGREGSVFAPLFLILAMGCGLAVAWYALFDALRRFSARSSPLPIARVRRYPI